MFLTGNGMLFLKMVWLHPVWRLSRFRLVPSPSHHLISSTPPPPPHSALSHTQIPYLTFNILPTSWILYPHLSAALNPTNQKLTVFKRRRMCAGPCVGYVPHTEFIQKETASMPDISVKRCKSGPVKTAWHTASISFSFPALQAFHFSSSNISLVVVTVMR